MTTSTILVGLIGPLIVIAGFVIMYLGHKSETKKKQEFINSIPQVKKSLFHLKKIMTYLFPGFSIIFIVHLLINIINNYFPKIIRISKTLP